LLRFAALFNNGALRRAPPPENHEVHFTNIPMAGTAGPGTLAA
jgi:hypothetical protein